MDDHNAFRWHGPRFSNTDSVFSRVHERFTKRAAKNVRAVAERFRTSRRWRQPQLCRSRKQDFVRLCHESNGTIASAKRKIAALGRRSLRLGISVPADLWAARRWVSWLLATSVPRLAERSDYISPIIVIHTFRRWGARRCSNRKMPCQVPSCISRLIIGTLSLVRVKTMRMCDGISSLPSELCSK